MKVIMTQNSEITDVSVEIHCKKIDADIEKLNKYISNYDERIKASCKGETMRPFQVLCKLKKLI